MRGASRGMGAWIALCTLVAGCNGGSASNSAGDVAPARTVGLRPGDAIRVQVWREEDLSGEFIVDQTGHVVLPLVGPKDVTGVPIDSLQAALVSDYRRYLENPSITVTALQRIAVLGEVRQPGLYPVDPTFTVTEALALAGGVAPSGDQGDIRLVRDGVVIRQTLDQSVRMGSLALRSGDQIVVGQRSWLVRNMALVTGLVGTVTTIVAIAVR